MYVVMLLSLLYPLFLVVETLDWPEFKLEYKKSYDNKIQDTIRKTIFEHSKEFILKKIDEIDFNLGINEFSDWTSSELNQMIGPLRSVNFSRKIVSAQRSSDKLNLPERLDWRLVPNRVTRVKNQGKCNSGWAFAVIGVMEGQELVQKSKSNGTLVSLSEQELVDCSAMSHDCRYGDTFETFNEIDIIGGLVPEASYPYEAKPSACRFNQSQVIIDNYEGAIIKGEASMREFLVSYGPIAADIDASSKEFLAYRSGIFNSSKCGQTVENHSVLIVGYDIDPEAGTYWIVKNSWGKSWGEEGYFRIVSGKNICGIENFGTLAMF